MAISPTQDKNLLVINAGQIEKASPTDVIGLYSLKTSQNAEIGGTFNSVGDLTVASDKFSVVAASGNTSIAGTLGVSNATTLSSTLGVSGVTTLAALNANATAITGTLSTSDKATLSSLEVTTTSALKGAVTAESTLGVTGATTLSSSLGVTGAATLSSTLAVTGAATLSSTLGVTGATTLSSTLGVSGKTTAADADFSSHVAIAGDLKVHVGNVEKFKVVSSTGNTSVAGTLAVAGTSTLTGNVTASGTVDVTGLASLDGGIEVGAQKFTVDVNGNVAGKDFSGAAATFTGAISGGSLTVSGAGSFGTTLSSGGKATLNSLEVTAGSDLKGTLAVTGAATLSSNLDVAGYLKVNTDKFTVDQTNGNTVVAGTLSAAGAATLSSSLAVTGATTLSSTLGVSGAATMSDALTVTGMFTGNGGALISGDVDISGDLTVAGDIVAKNKVNITVDDYFIDLGIGNTTTNVQSGGLTIEMNRAVGFTAWQNLAFTAGVNATSAPTITAGTAGSALANGDIICVVNADENNGYYVVNSVAGSVITLKGFGGAVLPSPSVPFVQTQVQSETKATAQAFKCDIGVFAMANGSSAFKDPSGASWQAGLFITAHAVAATEAYFAGNNAWQSVGQVGLNEAYGTDNTINLADGKNLIVNAPASGVAAIQYAANGGSWLRVLNNSLSLAVRDAGNANDQAALNFFNDGGAGDYSADLIVEKKINMQAGQDIYAKVGSGFFAQAMTGGTVNMQLLVDKANGISLQSSLSGDKKIVLDAGDVSIVDIKSDVILKADLQGNHLASVGYALGVTAGMGQFTVVDASGAAASPTSPNVMGVTLAAEQGGVAAVATMDGTLCRITKKAGASFSVGSAAFLAANGTISETAPTSGGSHVVRCGYIVANAGDAAPVVLFRPQYIAKILA